LYWIRAFLRSFLITLKARFHDYAFCINAAFDNGRIRNIPTSGIVLLLQNSHPLG